MLLGGSHMLQQTPSPPRDRVPFHYVGRRATASWGGLKLAGQPLATRWRISPGEQALFMLGQFNVPINFKTHTFSQALASSAQCSVWRALWGCRQVHRCGY